MITPAFYANLVCPSSLCAGKDGRVCHAEYAWDGSRRVCVSLADTDGAGMHFSADPDPSPVFSGDDVYYLSGGRLCSSAGFSFGDAAWETYAFALNGNGKAVVCQRQEIPQSSLFLSATSLPYRRDADHGFVRSYARRMLLLELPECAEHAASATILQEGSEDCRFLRCQGSFAVYAQKTWMLLDLDHACTVPLCPDFKPGGFAPVFSADGEYILAPGYWKGSPDLSLCRIWLKRDLPSDPVLDLPDLIGRSGLYADLSPDMPSLITPWRGGFLFVGVSQGKPSLYSIRETDHALRAEPFGPVPGAVLEVSACGSTLHLLWGDSTHPPRIVSLKDGDCSRFPVPPEDRSDDRPAPSVPVSAPSPDGKALLHARLILPEKRPSEASVPLLVWIHGGPEGFYADAFDAEKQAAVSKGYAVLLPNPRGSSGFGSAYQHFDGAFSDGAEYDVLTLLDAALRDYPCLDAGRVGVLGGSYGGFLSAALAGHTDRFRAAVIIKPVTNWLYIHFKSSQSGQPVFAEHFSFRDFLLETFRMSPAAAADQITIPTLILHGAQDQQCPPENSIQLYRLIQTFHPEVPCRLRLYPDLCHAYSRDGLEGYLSIQEETLQWMEAYLPICASSKEDSHAL